MKKAMAWILIFVTLACLTGCGGRQVEDLNVSHSSVTFTSAGETLGLNVTKIPGDSEGTVKFESSNESVAMVSNRGLIAAVGEGKATITISCGDVTRFCQVVCDFGGDISVVIPDSTGQATTATVATTPPETTEPVCADCGGKGLCGNCDGDPVCPDCKGEPVCTLCRNKVPGACGGCEGKKGFECAACHGDWVCDKCGGDGVCARCEGDKTCDYCDGSELMTCSRCDGAGDCKRCEGTGRWNTGSKCTSCNGKGKCQKCDGDGKMDCYQCKHGECTWCKGDAKCNDCGGDGDSCVYCHEGMNACNVCGGSGLCFSCQGEPVCKTCNGEGLICKKCNDGKCVTCGGKNAPKPTNPNPRPDQVPPGPNSVKCNACGGEGLCRDCKFGSCPKCTLGRVDCTSCEAGQCGRCQGLGFNWLTDKDCSYCDDGDCRSCNGDGDKDCPYCDDGGDCKTCGGHGWCTACGGNGYIG